MSNLWGVINCPACQYGYLWLSALPVCSGRCQHDLSVSSRYLLLPSQQSWLLSIFGLAISSSWLLKTPQYGYLVLISQLASLSTGYLANSQGKFEWYILWVPLYLTFLSSSLYCENKPFWLGILSHLSTNILIFPSCETDLFLHGHLDVWFRVWGWNLSP